MTNDDDLRQQQQQDTEQFGRNGFSPMSDTEFTLWSEQNLPLVQREMRRLWGIEEHAYAQAEQPYGASAADEMTWLFDVMAAYRSQQNDLAARLGVWELEEAANQLEGTAQRPVPQLRPLIEFASARLRATLTQDD